MGSAKTRYSRSTLRKILKAHCRKSVASGVDALVFLDYVSFLEEYVTRAEYVHNPSNNIQQAYPER